MSTIKYAHIFIHTFAWLPTTQTHVHTFGSSTTLTPTKFSRIFLEPHDFQQAKLECLETQPITSVVICWIVKAPKYKSGILLKTKTKYVFAFSLVRHLMQRATGMVRSLQISWQVQCWVGSEILRGHVHFLVGTWRPRLLDVRLLGGNQPFLTCSLVFSTAQFWFQFLGKTYSHLTLSGARTVTVGFKDYSNICLF